MIAIALSGCQSSDPPPTGALETPAQTAVASDPADIREAQRILNALGYGAGAADGVVGPRTRSAIANYQSRNGLEQTGQLTSGLLRNLRREAQVLQAARHAQTPKASRLPQPTKPAISTAQTQPPPVAAAAAETDLVKYDSNETRGLLGRVPRMSDPD